MARPISRRQWLAGASGLTLAFAVDLGVVGKVSRALAQNAFKPNVWVTIATDGTITIVSPSVEMGQGSMTGMPLLVAEELDADWSRVKVVQAPSNRAYGNPGFGGIQVTGASRSTPGYYMPLRLAGAQARRVLLDAVAAEWKVPVGELTTGPSVVIHEKSSRRITYGDVAKFAKAPAEPPKVTAADLKKKDQFRLIGTSVPRVEMPDKVTGAAKFGIDVVVPGLVYGAVLRPPVPGSAPEAVDDSAAKAIPGVTQIVPLPYGIGVIGTGYEAVHKGKNALKVTWKKGAPAESYSTDRVRGDYAAVAASLSKPGLKVHEQGDYGASMKKAERTFSAVYLSDHVYHATMEPMNATAHVSADGTSAELWVPTQGPTLNQLATAAALKTTPDKVTVHTTMLGGGFGRRLENDFVVDAVLLSKASGKPVKVIWSREDDLKNDKFRPLVAQYLEAGLDAEGNVAAWRHRMVSASIYARFNPPAYAQLKGKDLPVIEGHELSYAIPHQLHELFREERGWDVGLWRSVGAGYTKFASESFVDEMARAQGVDPVQFRLRLLAHDDRAARVVRAAAAMADWDRKRKGRALGIAFSDTWKSYIAAIAECSVDRATGKIRVHEVWCAVDPGIAIQPDIIKAQIEGAVTFGVSHVLTERVTVENGQVQQSNFHDYPLLRMADTPEIHVDILSTDNAPGGIGEVGLPPMGGAIGNAVATLTGARLRELPMLPQRVKRALAAVPRKA
jgi:isoquinoline 1-oxidoreductase beta subunit